MIVSEGVFTAVPWLILAVFVAIPIVWRFYPDEKITHVKRLGFLIAMIGTWASWAWWQHAGSDIVIVKLLGPGAAPQVTRGRLLGSTTYTFIDKSEKKISSADAKDLGTIVVNDSTTPMRIDGITYSADARVTLDNHTQPLPEMSVLDFDAPIDDIGPNRPPPPRMDSTIPLTAREWITWGSSSDNGIDFDEPRYGTKEWEAGVDAGSDEAP